MTSAAAVSTDSPSPAVAFRNAMAAAVTGVNIVTTDGPAGRFGLTVSSMTSVSAEPPMLLVSVNRRSPLLSALLENGVFGVSALGAHHDALADSFAGRPCAGDAAYDFGAAKWSSPSGVPLLADAAASFECRVSATLDAGTHTIVVGTVLAAGRGAVPPLAYTRRGYARVGGALRDRVGRCARPSSPPWSSLRSAAVAEATRTR